MTKKLMTIKYMIFVLCVTIGMLFISCSTDDGGDDTNESGDCLPGLVELPEDVLGNYTGELVTAEITNPMATATIVESSCKTYTINFGDNVPSITNVVFVSVNNSFKFGDNEREIGVDISAEGVLAITKTSEPILSFVEGKK